MPRRNRRAPLPELPIILPSFLADTEGEWAVELTNGSGRKVITLHGTKSSAWDWAQNAGARGGIAEGYWWPVAIASAASPAPGTGEGFLLVS